MSKERICVICGAEKTGGPRGKHYADKYEPCPKCRRKYLSKGVLLVEAIKDNAHPENSPTLTGGVLVLRDEAFKQLIDMPIPPRKISLVEPGLIQMIVDEINK